MHYVSGMDPAELFEEHQRFGRMHTPPALATRDFPNAPDPERRLRIGYLSPDIRKHSVAFFLEPLLDHRDRAALRGVLLRRREDAGRSHPAAQGQVRPATAACVDLPHAAAGRH